MWIEIIPRTLTFRQPAGTSRGIYHVRRVWYVVAHDGTRTGIGECAPLHDLSADYTPDYEAVLRQCCDRVALTGEVDTPSLETRPSVLFGLETAMLSLRRGDSALGDTPFARGECGIDINGLIWMGDHDTMLARIDDKLQSGCRCMKVKIGAIDFAAETDLLSHIRAAFPASRLELRVDANGGFTEDDVYAKLDTLARFDLHSIEQPVRAGQWRLMADIAKHSPVPVALDEEMIGVHGRDDMAALLDTIRPAYIVIKPTLHGGMTYGAQWIDMARERGIGWWITSALETNIGLNAIAHWCASYRTEMAQGLGTGLLFTDNVDAGLAMDDGRLWFRRSVTNDEMLDKICSMP